MSEKLTIEQKINLIKEKLHNAEIDFSATCTKLNELSKVEHNPIKEGLTVDTIRERNELNGKRLKLIGIIVAYTDTLVVLENL